MDMDMDLNMDLTWTWIWIWIKNPSNGRSGRSMERPVAEQV